MSAALEERFARGAFHLMSAALDDRSKKGTSPLYFDYFDYSPMSYEL